MWLGVVGCTVTGGKKYVTAFISKVFKPPRARYLRFWLELGEAVADSHI